MADTLPKPSVLLANRGYDIDRIWKNMDLRDVLTPIPMRKSRKMRVGMDHSLYSVRNLIVRCFNKLKSAHRVAPCDHKTAESFLGFMDIASIRLWLRLLST
jgi:transposase